MCVDRSLPGVACESTKQFHASRDDFVIWDGLKRRLGAYDDVLHEFSVSLLYEDVDAVHACFISPVESTQYTILGYTFERDYKCKVMVGGQIQ